MASKSENTPALIDEYEACPSTRGFPLFALSFQDFISNPVMTAMTGNGSSFFGGIIRRNPATFVDLQPLKGDTLANTRLDVRIMPNISSPP